MGNISINVTLDDSVKSFLTKMIKVDVNDKDHKTEKPGAGIKRIQSKFTNLTFLKQGGSQEDKGEGEGKGKDKDVGKDEGKVMLTVGDPDPTNGLKPVSDKKDGDGRWVNQKIINTKTPFDNFDYKNPVDYFLLTPSGIMSEIKATILSWFDSSPGVPTPMLMIIQAESDGLSGCFISVKKSSNGYGNEGHSFICKGEYQTWHRDDVAELIFYPNGLSQIKIATIKVPLDPTLTIVSVSSYDQNEDENGNRYGYKVKSCSMGSKKVTGEWDLKYKSWAMF